NDPDSTVWNAYGIRAWPTLVFLSPAGKVIGFHAGESTFEALDLAVSQMVGEDEGSGLLVRGLLPYTVQLEDRPPDRLAYPGKVLATEQGLFIADSGHHRILVADSD